MSPWTIALFVGVALVALYHVTPKKLWRALTRSGRRAGDRAEPSPVGLERSPYLAVCVLSLLPLVVLGGLLSAGAIAPDAATLAERRVWLSSPPAVCC